jgi:hypothetical protein
MAKSDYKWKTVEKKLKNGFTQRTTTVYRKDKRTINLKELKDIYADLEDIDPDEKYLIRALNEYRLTTVKGFNEDFDDDVNDDYLKAHGYNKKQYGDFYQVQFTSYSD